MPGTQPWSDDDRGQLERAGLSTAAADHQLAILTDPPAAIALDRPCLPGDGIERLRDSDLDALTAAWREAAQSGRFTKFVPASGAATRMFRSVAWFVASGLDETGLRERASRGLDTEAGEALRFFEALSKFPFADSLPRPRAEVEWRSLAQRLLAPDGIANLPKGLLPFHRYVDGARTAFEEHLREGLEILSPDGRTARLHLTVSPEHQKRFGDAAERTRRRLAEELEATIEIDFSTQDPATSVIALGSDGQPFRHNEGELLLRPGGHGSLLANLAASGGDLVYVKNIDNILPEPKRRTAVQWKRLLGGYLVELRRRIAGTLDALAGANGADAVPDAVRLVARVAGEAVSRSLPSIGVAGLDAVRDALGQRLDRPLRVCGMVRNEGEPGGGPFWVRDADGKGGESRQIVESSQVDLDDPEQRAVWESSTHFNPVDLACALRDLEGQPYDLARYVDPAAVFLAEKSHAGRPLRALEWPGLWNGAMAHWNTVFVEVPAETFAPVKTAFDLLRAEHRAEPPD